MVLLWRRTTNHLHPWTWTWPLPFSASLSLINGKAHLNPGGVYCHLVLPHNDSHRTAMWLLVKHLFSYQFSLNRKNMEVLNISHNFILTLPTRTGSGPVYSSMTKNWFQTHPRLDLWSTCPSFPALCLCLCSDKWPTSTNTFKMVRSKILI